MALVMIGDSDQIIFKMIFMFRNYREVKQDSSVTWDMFSPQ